MVMEDNSLGFAGVKDFSLHLWSRNVKGGAKWVQFKVIDLEKIMPMDKPLKGNGASVVGFAEGLGVIFVSTHVGIFMIELKSGLVKKVDELGVYFSVLPYMSFYTPDMTVVDCYRWQGSLKTEYDVLLTRRNGRIQSLTSILLLVASSSLKDLLLSKPLFSDGVDKARLVEVIMIY